MAHGALTPIIGLRLLALAAGLRHNAEIGPPGLCFRAYVHKFGINHLEAVRVAPVRPSNALSGMARGRRNRNSRQNDHELRIPSSSRSAVSSIPPTAGRRDRIPIVSQHGQIPVALPIGELDAVLVPFLAFELDIAIEDVRAERLPHQ